MVLVVLTTDKTDVLAGSFQASADKVVTLLPNTFTVHQFDVDNLGASEVHNQLMRTLEQGANIMHYIGHGSMVSYGRKSLLSATDIDSMSNIATPMLIVSTSCGAGSFGYPPLNSIGESTVLRANGAASNFFGATGLSENYLADEMITGFYKSLFTPEITRIGDAVVHGKQYYAQKRTERYLLDLYNLLGDPAMLVPMSKQ
ncbi:MAG: hypothetical protein D3923_18415 [Candidatus Electrothrix sp. AR3]|nr:hypothetical protein [Candidatus Electrothrix sp. AR3]